MRLHKYFLNELLFIHFKVNCKFAEDFDSDMLFRVLDKYNTYIHFAAFSKLTEL